MKRFLALLVIVVAIAFSLVPAARAQRPVATNWNDASLGGIENRKEWGREGSALRFRMRVTTDVRGRVERIDFPVGIDARIGRIVVWNLTARRHNIPRNVTRVVNAEYYRKGGFRID